MSHTGLRSLIATLEGHHSLVRGIEVSPCGQVLYTGGRDRVLLVWNLKSRKAIRTIPVFETIEGLMLLPEDFGSSSQAASKGPVLATIGDKGTLRCWDASTGNCTYTAAAIASLAQAYLDRLVPDP